MSHEVRIDFEKSYGRVLDLLKIYVDPAFIRVLVHFRSPSLHCFEFPQFDLVPTLEEDELMLRWPKSAEVYTYRGAHIVVDKVVALIKLPSHQSALVGSGNIKGWKLKLLEDHLSSLAEKEDWSAFNKTLALIVFGTTLFPFHADTVDHAAMDALFAWDVHLRSPMPAILADTLLSSYGALPDPLRSFPKIPLRCRYAMEWKAEVEHWSIDHFSWICPWFCLGDILIRCGDYPSVPLMGLRGCIAYSPKVAMRKLMRAQTVPSQEELGGLYFFHESVSLEDLHAICKAWEKPVYMGDGELGKARASVSIDYKEWRKRRGVPQPSTSLAPASANSELQDKVDALTKKLEIMGSQLRALEDKEQESSHRWSTKAMQEERPRDRTTQESPSISRAKHLRVTSEEPKKSGIDILTHLWVSLGFSVFVKIIGGMTRSGRVYSPKDLQDKTPKGKEQEKTEEKEEESKDEADKLLKFIRQTEEAIETSFHALEIANVEKHPRDMKKVIHIMTKNEFHPEITPRGKPDPRSFLGHVFPL
ncbi:hypothetical protein Fmac_001439 [Flemingia macrophylla]|uniref:DUF7745 domain-containing protein n=1 Tax=Flemingia macrophylla TaxID=520843 RepID=A0ABD1NH46_9FABA